ncbi:unnamed protein product, partial [Polarella glacialis]
PFLPSTAVKVSQSLKPPKSPKSPKSLSLSASQFTESEPSSRSRRKCEVIMARALRSLLAVGLLGSLVVLGEAATEKPSSSKPPPPKNQQGDTKPSTSKPPPPPKTQGDT